MVSVEKMKYTLHISYFGIAGEGIGVFGKGFDGTDAVESLHAWIQDFL